MKNNPHIERIIIILDIKIIDIIYIDIKGIDDISDIGNMEYR